MLYDKLYLHHSDLELILDHNAVRIPGQESFELCDRSKYIFDIHPREYPEARYQKKSPRGASMNRLIDDKRISTKCNSPNAPRVVE